jgi:hypothetical protein
MQAVDRFSSQPTPHIPPVVRPPAVRMFDADCKIMYRVPLSNTHNSLDNSKPSVQRRVGSPASFGLPPSGPSSVKNQVPQLALAIDVEPTSNTYRPAFLRWDTIPLFYLSAMTAGLSVLGIFGGAVGMTRTLLSISLFHSVLIPVTVIHCILVIDNKCAVGVGLVTIVYTSISVPLSLMFNTLTFASISFVVLVLFHIVAGVYGWRCILQIPILSSFLWFCVGGFPTNPYRGDTIGLIVIPSTQIFLVCMSGVLSTMSKQMETINSVVI